MTKPDEPVRSDAPKDEVPIEIPKENQPPREDDSKGKDKLVLKGVKGVAENETFYINYGQIVTIGRSRTADISLRRCPKYATLKPEEQKSEHILTISRKHLRIAFYNWQCVELKDLSTNGTFVTTPGGDKYEHINRKVITDIKEKTYEIRLGSLESFHLSVASETPAS